MDIDAVLKRGSRNSSGGVQVSMANKALTTVFFSPQLILQKTNGQFKKNLSSFFKVPKGSPTFSRGVQLFPGGGGGSNCVFPIKTYITCNFPGGGGGVRTPCPHPPPSGFALDPLGDLLF